MAIVLEPFRSVYNSFFGKQDITLNKEVWWWGRRHIDNGSILISVGAGEHFWNALVFFAFAVFTHKVSNTTLKNRILTRIFSHRAYAILPIILLITALYKSIALLKCLTMPSRKNEMVTAFKDILSEKVFDKLQIVSFESTVPSRDDPVFLAGGGEVIVIQYWIKTSPAWERKIGVFTLPFNGGYMFNGPGEFSDTLTRETAFLLKELFTKGKCSYDPLVPSKKIETSLTRP